MLVAMRAALLFILLLPAPAALRADTAAPGKPAGRPCLAGSECASGMCEGQGCDDQSPGRCAPSGRGCPRNHVPFCGCDGVTFHQSSGCPGQRYRHPGECARR
jgi:hypothetical protein